MYNQNVLSMKFFRFETAKTMWITHRIKDQFDQYPSYCYGTVWIFRALWDSVYKLPRRKYLLHDLSFRLGCLSICLSSLNLAAGGRFKNAYELLTLRALKFSHVNKIHIFQCMGKIFCMEFQRYPLKFHTKYLTHTLKDMIFMQFWSFKSS